MPTKIKTTDGEGFGEAAHFRQWEANMGATAIEAVQELDQLEARQLGAISVGHSLED